MTLALIAGRGALPAAIAAAQPHRPMICVLDGFAPDALDADLVFRLEHLGTLLADLSSRGVDEVCFCGAIRRPPIDPAKIDAATLPHVPLIMQALQSGDDAALRAVIELFATHGFAIRSAHDLAPDLIPTPGVLSTAAPDEAMRRDAARGEAVLSALAPLDVGQACIVGAGQVWAIEAAGGTDHMIATLPDEARDAGAVLVKAPKQGQDLRADLPTVGPETISGLAAAGLRGLMIRAGSTILLDRAETVRRADAAGLVIWACEQG